MNKGRTEEKRIGFFITSASWNNFQQWHYTTAIELNKRGFNVLVITRKKSRLYSKLRGKEIEVVPFEKKKLIVPDLYRLRNILNKHKIQTLFVSHHEDVILGGFAKKISKLEKLIFRKGTVSKIKSGFLNNIVYKNFVDSIITNSEANRKKMLRDEEQMLKNINIEVVYQGLNSENFNRLPHQTRHQNKGETLIIGLSNCSNDLQYCFDLLKSIKYKVDEEKYQFVIYQESNRSMITSKMRNLNLGKKIVCQKHASNIKDFMKDIDVFFSPVSSHSFNYPLLYAMAYGKPVLGIRKGSNLEIIKDKENGLLIDKYDSNSLIKALEKMRDPGRRFELGKKALETVWEKFDFKQSIDQIESII